MKKYSGAIISLAVALPVIVFAQWAPPPLNPGPITSVGGTSSGGILYLINQILFWVSTVFWIAAGIFVMYAAYLYLTAAGNEDQVSKAHHQLMWAAVAIAVGLMAAGLPYLVNQFLQGA